MPESMDLPIVTLALYGEAEGRKVEIANVAIEADDAAIIADAIHEAISNGRMASATPGC